MLLRASSEHAGESVGMGAVTVSGGDSGVPGGAYLVALAEAVVADDDEALESARRSVLDALGPAVLVDAAAVAGNFQRMVRIADGTGIPLDAPVELLTGDIREELGIDRFGSAANTQASGALRRAIGVRLRPLAMRAMRLIAPRIAR